ncbi:MAG: FeoA family protein [Verrucomicrobiota bacterium]
MTNQSDNLTLLKCPSGLPVRITGYSGGHGLQNRLCNLGLNQGQVVTKVHRQPFGGPVTVRMKSGAVIAVGRGMADHIIVEKENYETSASDR